MVMYPKVGECKRKLVGIISLKDFGATTNSSGSVDLLESSTLAKASKEMAEITAKLSAIVPGYMVPNSYGWCRAHCSLANSTGSGWSSG